MGIKLNSYTCTLLVDDCVDIMCLVRVVFQFSSSCVGAVFRCVQVVLELCSSSVPVLFMLVMRSESV